MGTFGACRQVDGRYPENGTYCIPDSGTHSDGGIAGGNGEGRCAVSTAGLGGCCSANGLIGRGKPGGKRGGIDAFQLAGSDAGLGGFCSANGLIMRGKTGAKRVRIDAFQMAVSYGDLA